MPVFVEDTTLLEDEVSSIPRTNRREAESEPLLYHTKPGTHPTPVEKRSPYWQPVDDQS